MERVREWWGRRGEREGKKKERREGKREKRHKRHRIQSKPAEILQPSASHFINKLKAFSGLTSFFNVRMYRFISIPVKLWPIWHLNAKCSPNESTCLNASTWGLPVHTASRFSDSARITFSYFPDPLVQSYMKFQTEPCGDATSMGSALATACFYFFFLPSQFFRVSAACGRDKTPKLGF